MSVLLDLAREHADFSRLIKRLEASAAGGEIKARRDVRAALLILLSALKEHQKVEDVVFGDPRYASKEEAKLVLDQAEVQHQEIQELRLEFAAAVASSDSLPIERLKFLASRMADALRALFKIEEECLWPHYRNSNRSLDAAIRRRVYRSVRALESGIAADSAALADDRRTRK